MQGLVPRGLARALPQLAGLEGLDVPVWGEAQLDLSNTGEILSGTIGIDAAPGQVLLPWLAATPLRIDGGHLALSYSRAARRFEIAPSVLVWGDSRVQFTGSIAHTAQGAEGPGWVFDLKSAGGWLGAEPPHLPAPRPIDDWRRAASCSPERGRVVLSQFVLRAGGAEVSAQGDIDRHGRRHAGAPRRQDRAHAGRHLQDALAERRWRRQPRDWVVTRLVRGTCRAAPFRLASGGGGGTDWTARRTATRLADARRLQPRLRRARRLADARGAARPAAARRATPSRCTAPDASFTAADGRRLALKGSLHRRHDRAAAAHRPFRLQGAGAAVAGAGDGRSASPFTLCRATAASLAGIDGKVDAQLTLSHAARPAC